MQSERIKRVKERDPMHKINLPPEGIFVGSGIYPTETDTLLCTMTGHYSWQCQHFSIQEQLQKVIQDNQGNLVQLWGVPRGFSPQILGEWIYDLPGIGINLPAPDWEALKNLTTDEFQEIFDRYADRKGAGFLRFIREAKELGLYTTLIYRDSDPQWIPQMVEEGGDRYLGYDFGERFSTGLDRTKDLEEACGGTITLRKLADRILHAVQEHALGRKKQGWKFVMATSSDFHLDYEVLGGADMPVVEDFAFPSLNFSSALSRGLYRQHDLPMWGSHLAHEHYDWQPNSAPHRYDTLRAAFYLKYMAGSKMIINESGNWFVEHTLSPDSPRILMPHTAWDRWGLVGWNTAKKLTQEDPEGLREELQKARPFFPKADYRDVISDFWNFVKENGTPEGQPETTLALVKGNLDLASARYNHGYAIGGTYELAMKDPSWFEGAPERGWKLARQVFFPEVPVLKPYVNIHLSGTPYGQVDVVSFAYDQVTANHLLKQYKALLFTGWNTCSEKQYGILKDYVKGGGTLFISLPQLAVTDTRRFDLTTEDLINGGDFSDLCGVKVRGKGDNIYWAMIPQDSHQLESEFPRRYGILGVPVGDLEQTDPELQVLITDDEIGRPVLTLHRYGKGKCYFLNTWAYPGACDLDEGPGSQMDSAGMIGCIYRSIAKENRGYVYLTDDGIDPGEVCKYVAFSYFPDAGKICLLNIDFESEKTFWLHQFGVKEPVTLAPGEFRLIETASLKK